MKSKDYEEFVEKFKPKKTTDDCYTPPLVYDAVKGWACTEYDIDPEKIVRPFWPGADYEHFDYPSGCVVLDNPPFSILTKICEFFLDRKIKFFLFAPNLTMMSSRKTCMRMNHIVCDADIEYENGAIVHTGFVTNLSGNTILQTAPSLGKAIQNAVEETKKETKRTLPRYEYPDNVVTTAMLGRYSKLGIEFKVSSEECVHISALDAQKEANKTVFGAGLLISNKAAKRKAAAERAAAERATAERATAHRWELSEREREIIAKLG